MNESFFKWQERALLAIYTNILGFYIFFWVFSQQYKFATVWNMCYVRIKSSWWVLSQQAGGAHQQMGRPYRAAGVNRVLRQVRVQKIGGWTSVNTGCSDWSHRREGINQKIIQTSRKISNGTLSWTYISFNKSHRQQYWTIFKIFCLNFVFFRDTYKNSECTNLCIEMTDYLSIKYFRF